jgi:hypothetical protein
MYQSWERAFKKRGDDEKFVCQIGVHSVLLHVVSEVYI